MKCNECELLYSLIDHFTTLKNQKEEELDAQITHIIIEIAKFRKEESELVIDLDKLRRTLQDLIQASNKLERG